MDTICDNVDYTKINFHLSIIVIKTVYSEAITIEVNGTNP